MATTIPARHMVWLACVAIAGLSHTACSAQAPTTSPSARTASDRSTPAKVEAAVGGSLRPGEYATKKGWGRLLIKEQDDALTFSLESVTGEDICELDGAIQGNRGIAKGDDGSPACTVNFRGTAEGIDVAAATPAECEMFCGYNGDFEGSYLRVKDGCARIDLDRTRDEFKRLYESKDYKAALATLSPTLADCLPTLEWEEEGAIRNDFAITQYRNGLHAECLATLEKYAEDAAKSDAAAIEGWTPALADRYLSIVQAARTNIGLCRKGLANK